MIVVTTPTGRIGRQLVDRLLEQHSDVRVVLRDPSRLDPATRDRVQAIQGSHADEEVLDRALAGADALFWLVPPDPSAPDAMTHYLRFARFAAAAIARHRVGHVVSVSSAGHDWTGPAGILSAAFAMDAELASAASNLRALSMPFYMENLLGQAGSLRDRGAFSLTCFADAPLPTIATRDIAAKAADLLTNTSWEGRAHLPLFGPGRLTPAEMARVIGDELGQEVVYEQMSMDDFAQALRNRGASTSAIEDTVAMFAAQSEGIYDADWERAEVSPTDFRTWCREVLVPSVRRR